MHWFGNESLKKPCLCVIFILAADYDGTLALHGIVSPSTIASIKKVKASGRKVILVTGRELEELQQLFPDFILFDLIVAENGALIFDPCYQTGIYAR
jgi:HAD superfamily hydrolase (TIGR01484 family)